MMRKSLILLCCLPLALYPLVGTSNWKSSSDVHALLEFSSSLLAMTAGLMVLLHFLTTGRWFFLILSVGFMQVGAEEIVHAVFSFDRLWPEISQVNRWAISSTWLAGRSVLLLSFLAAYFFGQRICPQPRRVGRAVLYNAIGFLCSVTVVLFIFTAPYLPSFVRTGSPSKMLIELSIGAAFLLVTTMYLKRYLAQDKTSPLLLSIVMCTGFQVVIHLYFFNVQSFYDARWDMAHLLKLVSYFFPIYGVWGETIKIHQVAQGQLAALEMEFAEKQRYAEQLARYRDHLEELVEGRTAELRQALDQLRRTSDQLMQAEKLAALGAMVAGISHELNTPIGNALVMATTLEHAIDDVASQVRTGAIKRSVLDEFFRSGKEMCGLAVRAIERAATLVTGFKRVAVDQASEQRHEFELRQLLEDQITSARPALRHQGLRFVNTVEAGIVCDSYPGPLGHIFSNIVQNSDLHGYEGRSPGTVSIAAERHGGDIALRIADDGIGMTPHVLAHVFDPFFTTRLGTGGSGLGMAVCHRIARSVLGGDLQVVSAPGLGTCCTLTFPSMAPFPLG